MNVHSRLAVVLFLFFLVLFGASCGSGVDEDGTQTGETSLATKEVGVTLGQAAGKENLYESHTIVSSMRFAVAPASPFFAAKSEPLQCLAQPKQCDSYRFFLWNLR